MLLSVAELALIAKHAIIRIAKRIFFISLNFFGCKDMIKFPSLQISLVYLLQLRNMYPLGISGLRIRIDVFAIIFATKIIVVFSLFSIWLNVRLYPKHLKRLQHHNRHNPNLRESRIHIGEH